MGTEPNKNRMNISVIVPALNEEQNILSAIADTLKAIDILNISGEVVVINDGSTDRTRDLVNDAIKKSDRVKMVSHDSTQGLGASFWDGVDNAKGDIVLCLPGDNENDPWEILRYYDLLKQVDIVIPFIYNKEVRPIFRRMLSSVYRFIINATFLVSFNYTNGTVLYRKTILKELKHRSKGFFFQTDILIRAIKRGYLFAEVPHRLGFRNDGISKAISFPSLMQVIKGYLRLLKDIYFHGNRRKIKKQFADDSLTFKRNLKK